MKAARVERQEQAEGERKREIEDGGGGEPSLGWDHLRRLLCWEIMRAHKAVLGRRAGAPGEPRVRRVSSVESGAGVCARGLPHTVPPPRHSPHLPTTASHRLMSLMIPLPPPLLVLLQSLPHGLNSVTCGCSSLILAGILPLLIQTVSLLMCEDAMYR